MGSKSDFIKKIYHRLLENRILSRWVVLLIDLTIVLCATLVSYVISGNIYDIIVGVDHPSVYEYMLITVGITFVSFLIFRTYIGIVRYSTIREFQHIFLALLVSSIGVFLCLYFIAAPSGSISLAYCISYLLFSLLGLSFFRILVVHVFGALKKKYSDKTINVFLWGVSEETIAMSLLFESPQSMYRVKGFIDDDKPTSLKKNTKYLIVGKSKEEITKHKIKNILLLKSQDIKRKKETAHDLIKSGVSFYLMQDLNVENLSDLAEISKTIRPIQIEDLLGRPEIKISHTYISKNVDGKVILVSGAAGSIGCEIVKQLAKFNPKLVVCLDQAETPLHNLGLELSRSGLNYKLVIGDVRRLKKLSKIFEEYKPTMVYHAAAYKHVPLMEIEPSESILTNVLGTKCMVDLSIAHNVEVFVMVSTDKAVNPTNIMGASKRIAEIYVQTRALYPLEDDFYKTKFVTTRFGNVLGSNGSVVPLFKEQIQKGGPVTVTHKDVTRYFMTIPEACRLVLEASHIGKSGYIYIFDMGEPVKIYDLAVKMIELAGLTLDEDIKIEITGLRPGEKLYEELLNNSELTEETSHPKIKIAKVRANDNIETNYLIGELIKFANLSDDNQVVKLMKQLVPEFVSQNSQYMFLDCSLAEKTPQTPINNI